MAVCLACGKKSLLTTEFGCVTFCKSCASKVKMSDWKKRDFSTLEELMLKKNDALQLASSNNFSSDAMQAIASYFNEYINAGYITTINGKAGQLLRVFGDFCIIDTKNEEKMEELASGFYEFIDDDDDDDDSEEESFISANKDSIVKGLLRGKLVETGVGLVASAAINSVEKEKAAEHKAKEKRKKEAEIERKVSRIITVGEQKVYLRDIGLVETYSAAGIENGYLRFIPEGYPTTDYYSCRYFFFRNTLPIESKKIKKQLESIKTILNNRINNIKDEAIREEQKRAKAERESEIRKIVAENQPKVDPFEEIRKYKMLLDEGIISQEEFAKKKTELLGV